ncbi:MAG: trypsin-like peptidase domain-containing protein [Saprospiraceae bacterium]|nr:trypsin-like peptidase domain-containing protein [Saprospiraceae bacterium]
MKNHFIHLLSGVFGGLLVLSGFIWYQKNNNQAAENLPLTHSVSSYVNNITGPDFSLAAEKALNSVVQINAQESDKLARQKMEQNDPFSNHPFFREFDLRSFGFGMPYQQKKGSGSGVIYSQDGYIVTNNHVVEFADDIEVILEDGRKFSAKKIGNDPRTDLAIIKVEADNLPVLPIANSDQIKIGEWVLAVGNPFGYLTSTVTAGIVSAKGRDLNLLDHQDDQYYNPFQQKQNNNAGVGIEEYIQTDAAVNPGNSGGALVDVNGRLVGINSAIASKTGYYTGYSFAIPSNLMVKIVRELIQHGSFDRGRFGVGVVPLDEELKKELNLNTEYGVVITELEDKGSAKYAGLLPNDLIIEVNNKSIKSVEELQKVVALSKVGETLYTKVIRNGQVKEIPVKIRKML